MITLNHNNFGGGIITLNEFQSNGFCILNGKIVVNPTHPDYIVADRLELDLPSDFLMSKSAMSSAVLVSNISIYRDGTLLRCWIEKKKLCIEKLTVWDSFGNYEIYIYSAFVERGYRGQVIPAYIQSVVFNQPELFRIVYKVYKETHDFIFMALLFNKKNTTQGQGPFTLQLTPIATDVSIQVPIFFDNLTGTRRTGNNIVIGTLENGSLTFNYPGDTSSFGEIRTYLIFYAIRNITNVT